MSIEEVSGVCWCGSGENESGGRKGGAEILRRKLLLSAVLYTKEGKWRKCIYSFEVNHVSHPASPCTEGTGGHCTYLPTHKVCVQ